jgi:hypothetical protein
MGYLVRFFQESCGLCFFCGGEERGGCRDVCYEVFVFAEGEGCYCRHGLMPDHVAELFGKRGEVCEGGHSDGVYSCVW